MSCPKSFIQFLVLPFLALLLSSCGGGGNDGPSTSPGTSDALTPLLSTSNVHAVTVDGGPPNTGYNVNRLYTNVTLCYPGSQTRCKVIDHVLVDTGSSGLRLFAKDVADLGLARATASNGKTLLNCAQFVDGTFSWGPVAAADVILAGKIAASLPIQVIADPQYSSTPRDCAGGNDVMKSAKDMGGNGILGIGFLKEDCGNWCDNHTDNGFYYTCTDTACTTVAGQVTPVAKQVKNPIPKFATDNNGFLIELPAVNQAGAISIDGTLTFGVGTQANNRFSSGNLLQPDLSHNFKTTVGTRSWTSSFIDTGSNGYYFDYTGLAPCDSPASHFYCPGPQLTLGTKLEGDNHKPFDTSVVVTNALPMFTTPLKAALPTLAGPINLSNTFDYGLPFFYGRRVFVTIDAMNSVIGIGPMYGIQ